MIIKHLKVLSTSLALLCSLTISVQAKASDKASPYIGAGYQFNQLSHTQGNASLSTGTYQLIMVTILKVTLITLTYL